MADTKISELTLDVATSGDLVPIARSGANYSLDVLDISKLSIEDAINSGETAKAPTENAVFNALSDVNDAIALKQDILSVATGAEVDAGTDNTKYITAQALKDSLYLHKLITSIVTTGGTTVLTTEENKSTAFEITGTLTSDATIQVADIMQNFIVDNATTGAFTVTFKTAAGLGFTIPQGSVIMGYANGTDAEATTGVIGSASWGSITGLLSNQTDLSDELALKAPLASPTFTGTVSGVTAAMVGLGNVDNTSDATKNAAAVTLTNKDIQLRVSSTTSAATINVDSDLYDKMDVTALAVGATVALPTGTPTNGRVVEYEIIDNGTARALSYNANIRQDTTTALPTTTVVGTTLKFALQYSSANAAWHATAPWVV